MNPWIRNILAISDMKANRILLILAIFLCGATGYVSYKTSLQVKELKAQVRVSEQKIDSLMIATAKIAKSTKTVSSKAQPKSFWELLFSELEEEEKAAANQKKVAEARAKVTVSTSYRLEDRYVVGKVELPETLGSQAGTITVNVSVSRYGSVKKTSVAEGATITDPEVVEAVRRAALQTDFNSNYDAPELVEGTITYTFKKK
jgi:hypothetical protein